MHRRAKTYKCTFESFLLPLSSISHTVFAYTHTPADPTTLLNTSNRLFFSGHNPYIYLNLIVFTDHSVTSAPSFPWKRVWTVSSCCSLQCTRLTVTVVICVAAYLNRKDYNVFTVDWEPLTFFPCYLSSLSNSRLVAQCTAQFYAHLTYSGASAYDIHCVGHSIGAHICGMISNHLSHRQHKIIGKYVFEFPSNDLYLQRVNHSWKLVYKYLGIPFKNQGISIGVFLWIFK